MSFQIKLIIIAIVLGLVAFGSWSARGWYEDSKWKDAYEDQAEKHKAKVAVLNSNNRSTQEKLNEIEKQFRGKPATAYRTIIKRECFTDAERLRLNEDAGLTEPAGPDKP